MAAKLVIKEEYCKSCGLCVRACPKNALSIGKTFNTNSYAYVTVEEELCIACGACYTVCPDYVFEIER